MGERQRNLERQRQTGTEIQEDRDRNRHIQRSASRDIQRSASRDKDGNTTSGNPVTSDVCSWENARLSATTTKITINTSTMVKLFLKLFFCPFNQRTVSKQTKTQKHTSKKRKTKSKQPKTTTTQQ